MMNPGIRKSNKQSKRQKDRKPQSARKAAQPHDGGQSGSAVQAHSAEPGSRPHPQLRLQRFLAECGVAARRKAEDLIRLGKVTVNGAPAELGMRVDPFKDTVCVSGRQVSLLEKGAAIFNKPAGVVTTRSDPQGRKSIVDFLPKSIRSYFPVGRLDYDSCGLVVLTNDGDLADVMLHPRYEIPRRYVVKLEGVLEPDLCERAKAGVQLEDGIVHAAVKVLKNGPSNSLVEVSLTEGKNRIVRRMFAELGHQVMMLKRIMHGPFTLGDLKSGELRRLSPRGYRGMRDKLLGRKREPRE